MRTISDTIARLAALKAMYGAGTAARDGSPGRLSPLSGFGSNPGGLQASYHVPEDFRGDRPLVVVLHGCTQSADAYDHHSGWSQLANEAGFALLYPEQQRGNNPNLCFNWFLPGDTQRHAGEVLSIRQMIDAMVATHGIDRDRVFVTGLSAGGAMAASMLATHPEVFAGGAIIAGLAHGTARTVPEAFDRMRGQGLPTEQGLQRLLRDASDHAGPWPRISIWQGTADQTVAPVNADAIAAQWRSAHGLDGLPTYSKEAGPLVKRVWCDPAGDAVIEVNLIAGMGHGTPLAPGLGGPGPYMLDVGVSSTRDIAGFFGIATAEDNRNAAGSRFRSPAPAGGAEDAISHDPRMIPPKGRGPNASGVQKVIEDALRAAGLMR